MVLLLGTAGADAGFGLVNAAAATVGSGQGINGVGISLQTITTAGNGLFYSLGAPASVATALNTTTTAAAGAGLRSTNSFAFTKTIINPLAVYRTLVSQNTVGTADVITVAAAASNTTIQLVITGAGTPTATLQANGAISAVLLVLTSAHCVRLFQTQLLQPSS